MTPVRRHLTRTHWTLRGLRSLEPQIERAARLMADALRRGGKVIAVGNGGSAAQASHFAAELLGRYRRERGPLAALSLTDPAVLTALANDYGYECVYGRQVAALSVPGDVLLCLSTSGKSQNVRLADHQDEVPAVWVTHGDVRGLSEHDVVIRVPGVDTAHTQEATLVVLHILAGLIEEELS